MFKTIRARHKEVVWQKQYDPLAPKVGDVAPDFVLYDSEGENQISLSDFRGKKPVALVFGSYT